MTEQKIACPVCGTEVALEDEKAESIQCPYCGEKIVFGEKAKTN
ncbi:MAG: DNA-directed RNA polymerase subunit P [Thermoplasmatota archaeon]